MKEICVKSLYGKSQVLGASQTTLLKNNHPTVENLFLLSGAKVFILAWSFHKSCEIIFTHLLYTSVQRCKKCSTFLRLKFQVLKPSSKPMWIIAFKLQNILITSFKIGFLFLVPTDLALICWNLPQWHIWQILTGGTRMPVAFLHLCQCCGNKWQKSNYIHDFAHLYYKPSQHFVIHLLRIFCTKMNKIHSIFCFRITV